MIDDAKVRQAVANLLTAIGQDPVEPPLADTPRRVSECYRELFRGYGIDAASCLAPMTNSAGLVTDLIAVRDLQFRSMCEHHLLPFHGSATVIYLPDAHLTGLSGFARALDAFASRLQLQERLTEQLADAIDEALHPRGILVALTATHGCVSDRATRQRDSTTTTLSFRGILQDPVQRATALAVLRDGRAANTHHT